MDNWENACIASDSQSVLVCLRNSRGGESMIVECAEILSHFCMNDKYIAFV